MDPLDIHRLSRATEKAHIVNLQARLPGFKRKFPELQQHAPVKR